jgi:hypothetical protein
MGSLGDRSPEPVRTSVSEALFAGLAIDETHETARVTLSVPHVGMPA